MTRFFFPYKKPDGSKAWVNLSQAAEIHLISDEECHIKFVDGGVVQIATKDGVDAIIQAIGEAVVLVHPLPRVPQQ